MKTTAATGHFDGMTITDVIAHIYKFAYPPEPPKQQPEPPDEEPAGTFGFCDYCEHTHAFCKYDG